MAAYGLYTHIQSNKRRSIALLIGLFFLVYLMVYAGALMGSAIANPAFGSSSTPQPSPVQIMADSR